MAGPAADGRRRRRRWCLCLAAALLLAAAACPAAADEVLQLHTLPWQLSNGFGNASLSEVWLPTAALQALHAAGIVDDPLFRYNERELRWAALDTWTFSVEFEAPPALLGHRSVQLRCTGLDTVAALELNDAPLGSAANAHRPHAWEAKHLLQPGANRLAITLQPAAAAAAQRAAAYPYSVPATAQLGALPHYNFLRKAASDFGWDWGPTFAPAAITGPVELLGRSEAVLDGVAVRQRHFLNGSVAVEVDALLLPPPPLSEGAPAADGQPEEAGQLLLELASPDGRQRWRVQRAVSTPPAAEPARGGSSGGSGGGSSSSSSGSSSAGAGSCPWLAPDSGGEGGETAPVLVRHTLSLLVEAPQVQLWWPHDFGPQPLYSLTLTYSSGEAASSAPAAEGSAGGGASGSSLTRRVGLRRVELVMQPLPAGGPGESFSFRVNGQPLYARGANVVPAHIFEPAVTPAQLRALVADARAAHMNMLRVWGGGRYAQDAFYDACDELGLLVWQEAMFACAMYPSDDAFLREAWLEVRHQAARLSSHPSVAVWGGNNENEAAFQWFPEPLVNPRLYAVDYSRLFVDAVRDAVHWVDPSLPYVDSSPSNGLLSAASPVAKRWGDVTSPLFGDVHFYDYQADALDPATYPPAKFVSEFGFMSLPSWSAYKRVTAAEDWALDAPMTAYRMRHANGLEELQAQMARHFLPPPPSLAPPPPPPQPQQQPQTAEQLAAQARAALAGLPREQLLAQMAEGQAALTAAFEAAEAAGQDPVAAVHAAAAAAAARNASASPDGAAASEQQQQQLQSEAGLPREQRRFAAFTYLSQLQQALAYQTAVGQWRRNKADPGALTMGVLYWQLNDIWQGPSWAGINADGSWRLLQHAATEFFRPVAVSGVRRAAGGALEVHLTNDLPVDVTGTLEVDAIPYAATLREHVVPLYRTDSASVRAFDSKLAWTGTIAADVLPAARSVPAGPGGQGSRPVEAPDVLLRLRYCPSAVQAHPGLANPFSAAATGAPAVELGGGGSAVERAATGSDGSSSSNGGSCVSPVQLPPGAGAAQCAAAARLLACSESLLLLTEPKAARLVPANVNAEVAPPAGGEQPGAFDLLLSSDAVALWVSPEAEGQPGRFNASGLLLLPWQPQALRFEPASATATAAAGAPAPAVEAQDGSTSASASPGVSVYWLQQAMAELAADHAGGGEAASAASGRAALAPSACLCIAALLFSALG